MQIQDTFAVCSYAENFLLTGCVYILYKQDSVGLVSWTKRSSKPAEGQEEY